MEWLGATLHEATSLRDGDTTLRARTREGLIHGREFARRERECKLWRRDGAATCFELDAKACSRSCIPAGALRAAGRAVRPSLAPCDNKRGAAAWKADAKGCERREGNDSNLCGKRTFHAK